MDCACIPVQLPRSLFQYGPVIVNLYYGNCHNKLLPHLPNHRVPVMSGKVLYSDVTHGEAMASDTEMG